MNCPECQHEMRVLMEVHNNDPRRDDNRHLNFTCRRLHVCHISCNFTHTEVLSCSEAHGWVKR